MRPSPSPATALHLAAARHVPARIALIATTALALVLAACSSSATPGPVVAATAGTAASIVTVRLTDELRMEPASLTVQAGASVRFVVSNAGALEHEFYVGDEVAQAAHEKEMAGSGSMSHDHPLGIGVKPGQTKEVTVTFRTAGTMYAGCHIPGHYPAGMKMTIAVK